jgi:ABC-type multidrug transport system ATPase subunit
MIQNITFNANEISYIFGNEEREIEINLGSIRDGFWGENISMVSAIVGKNGTGKSSILRYIKNRRISTFPYNYEDNIIYFSPHLDYLDNYSFDVDPNDISLDTILRRDLENIIDDEKEPNENGWSLNPKQDLQHLNTARQMDFLSSSLREQNSVFFSIFEGLKFEIGIVSLRGSSKIEASRESFHNTPYQFRQIILDILVKCDEEVDSWVTIRRMDGEEVLNQHEINAYIFKRNLISSFLTIVINLMERNNTFLSEGVIDEFDTSNYTAIELFNHFIKNAKVHFNGQSSIEARHVFNSQVLELFEYIYNIVDEIQDHNSVKNKAFNTDYINLEKIGSLQKEIVNHLSNNYYNQKVRVSDFLGIKSTDRKLSSGENALLNFYAVLYERVQNIDREQIHDEYILLLDEADLGYHPEWKKRFVNSIVKSLPLFFNFSNTQSKIQIIFTTHDPLTLSDIPRQNVIFLNKNGEGKTIISNDNKETFGANIHDLLADSFFISDGLMGDFAKEKIDRTILWLRYKLLVKEVDLSDEIEDLILEQKKQELNEIAEENRWVIESPKEQHKQIIDLVDEPLLRYKMKEMYYQIFPDEVDKEEARRRIMEIARNSGLNINIDEQ